MRISFYSVSFRLSRGKRSRQIGVRERYLSLTGRQMPPLSRKQNQLETHNFAGIWEPLAMITKSIPSLKVRLPSGGGFAAISNWDESGWVSNCAACYEIRKRNWGIRNCAIKEVFGDPAMQMKQSAARSVH